MQGLNLELSAPGVLTVLSRIEDEMARDLRGGDSSVGGGRTGKVPASTGSLAFLPSGRMRRFGQGCDIVWQCHASSYTGSWALSLQYLSPGLFITDSSLLRSEWNLSLPPSHAPLCHLVLMICSPLIIHWSLFLSIYPFTYIFFWFFPSCKNKFYWFPSFYVRQVHSDSFPKKRVWKRKQNLWKI